jgi:hypothetical protein
MVSTMKIRLWDPAVMRILSMSWVIEFTAESNPSV